MLMKTVFVVIFFTGFICSPGFFINNRDVRKFFGFIPRLYDFYRREGNGLKWSRERAGHNQKYEDNINEKLNNFYVDTEEKYNNILDYEDSNRNGNYGQYLGKDNRKNRQHREFKRLQELDERIKSGKLKLVEVKSNLKNNHISLTLPENEALREVDNIFPHENYQEDEQYDNFFGEELDYFHTPL